jgi:hypothetical protein
VLERSGQRQSLTAIRLKDPGMKLYLEAKQGRNASADAEIIPILYATGTTTGRSRDKAKI